MDSRPVVFGCAVEDSWEILEEMNFRIEETDIVFLPLHTADHHWGCSNSRELGEPIRDSCEVVSENPMPLPQIKRRCAA
ncbi:hypothetical protein ASC87_15100 [Rhizobacter sp. Root1221]|nr:hypothetical protein ASC87_15100 [Rhizobacter sp. Root1221]